ncbi:MAG: hypothetical protein HY660_17760 [Armatimonadetes bacterium]|nr:hypothetical protein [Armatimonadota bacterium]
MWRRPQTAAAPVPDPTLGMARVETRDAVPTPIGPARGCPFAGRCSKVMDVRRTVTPLAVAVAPNHVVSCHLYG